MVNRVQEPMTEELIRAKLRDAAVARSNLLRQVAVDAHDRVQHAKQVVRTEREAAAALAASRRRFYETRMAAAAARREQRLREFSAAHSGRSPDSFLRARAMCIEQVRHGFALRRLQTAWREFVHESRPTAMLIQAFVATRIPGVFESMLDAGSIPQIAPKDSAAPHIISSFGGGQGLAWQRNFDSLSTAIQAPETLRATRALLARLETLLATLHGSDTNPECSLLLKRLHPRAARTNRPIERYPARIILCAYMIHAFPEALFNRTYELEDSVRERAVAMLKALEALLVQCLQPPSGRIDSVRNLVKLFDEAWVDFLSIFLPWKHADAASMEAALISIAAEMQSSMLAAVGNDPTAASANPQVAAIVAQVEHDQALLRARVGRLSGLSGLERFDSAIAAAQACPSARHGSLSPARTTPRAVPIRRQSSEVRSSVSGSLENTPVDMHARGRHAAPASEAMPSANEMLMQQLLMQPTFQLPQDTIVLRWAALMESTGERVAMPQLSANAPAVVMQQHIRALAQDALVDAALQQLTSLPNTASTESLVVAMQASIGQMLAIISELAQEVFEALPEQHPAHEQRADFEPAALQALPAGATSIQEALCSIAGLLDKTVRILIQARILFMPVHVSHRILHSLALN
jgi:hypothetical protein